MMRNLRLASAVVLYVIFVSALFAEIDEDFVYDSGGKRDPFIPLITQKAKTATSLEDVETPEDIRLEGIVWDTHGGSIAILNGVIVKEGQVAGNVKVNKIEKKSVTLSINEIEYNITLLKKGE